VWTCPDDVLAVGVLVFELIHDVSLQFGDGFADATADSVFGELSEEGSTVLSPEPEVGVT
jgi:hypothetical protein